MSKKILCKRGKGLLTHAPPGGQVVGRIATYRQHSGNNEIVIYIIIMR